MRSIPIRLLRLPLLVTQNEFTLSQTPSVLILTMGKDAQGLAGIVSNHLLSGGDEGILCICWLGKANALAEEAH